MNNLNHIATDPTKKSLEQWLSYLESIHPSAIDMGLERVKSVAEILSINLHDSFVITVAGTNGKGTTCRLLEQALLAQGKSVAVYGSPHLISYCERVRLNGELASESDFCQTFELIENARVDITLTYFEFGTLAAMKMMQDSGVDVAILEVGLGGRLDATNILDADLAIITTIDLDHQEYLGNTREQIAREKAGIMRPNGKAVIGEFLPIASLSEAVEQLNVDAMWANRDFSFHVTEGNTAWRWQGKLNSFNSLPYPNIPIQNASTALAALEVMGLLPEEKQLQDILSYTRLPGRQQKISDDPRVVVDVAHNPQATKAMKEWLLRYSASKLHIVVGMLRDKSIAQTIAPLATLPAQWYVGSTSGPRGCQADIIQQALLNEDVQSDCINTFGDITSAYNNALKNYQDKDLVLVFGSFVTVANVLEQQ